MTFEILKSRIKLEWIKNTDSGLNFIKKISDFFRRILSVRKYQISYDNSIKICLFYPID